MKGSGNPILLLLILVSSVHASWAFTPSSYTLSFIVRSTARPSTVEGQEPEKIHPAVQDWPEKYSEAGGNPISESNNGPRVISLEFDVHQGSETELSELDVEHWPTWTTSDKPKWAVGNQVVDKEMPYGELSYVISGKLEIIPQSTGVPVIVNVGDLVTFPKGFIASWRVLEELTWHYYLY